MLKKWFQKWVDLYLEEISDNWVYEDVKIPKNETVTQMCLAKKKKTEKKKSAEHCER